MHVYVIAHTYTYIHIRTHTCSHAHMHTHTHTTNCKEIVPAHLNHIIFYPLLPNFPIYLPLHSVSRANTMAGAMSAYWSEVSAMAFSTEKEISTVLLVFPELALFGNDYRYFTFIKYLN